MRLKKGLCLILCLLLIGALLPLGALAVWSESVDGVWASIALTGGANKLIFSANSEIENQILYPDGQTDAQYLLPEGVSYDAASNTLSLTDFDSPTAKLVLTMMGADFKISLSGSSRLDSIRSDSLGRGGSISFCGDGSLELVSLSDTAILVNAGGAADFVRIEPQLRLTASSGSGSAIRVYDTALSADAIRFDTTVPQVYASDGAAELTGRFTTDGTEIDVYTATEQEGLFGLAYTGIDEQSESILYDVYRLGAQDESGAYSAEKIAEKVSDLSGYALARSPHDWTLCALETGAQAASVRFARFAVSAEAPEGHGRVILSQTAVGRGGRVEISTEPEEGYKLSRLTIDGAEVQPSAGGYIIDGVTSDRHIVASFAEAAPVQLVVTAPASAAFEVPADGADAFVSEPFTATVTDGAGDPVAAHVVWSVEPQTEGISVSADGRVTVTNAAKSAAAEPICPRVRASLEGTELSDTEPFTVARAQRRAASVVLSRGGEAVGESDQITIPAAGESAAVPYGAAVFDQYGAALEEEIVWSASALPEGLVREDGVLSLTDECADGAVLTLTATAASDETVSSSVTVTCAAPATLRRSSAPLRGAPPAPVTAWPTVSLAEDARYGLTWAQLVTLTGGTADVEGVFSLNKSADALPNVSDSFKLVFSYADADGETRTVEEDGEHSVSLAKKAISEDMITLIPAELPYTGTAREPAVSLSDGGRALVPNTDFTVTGYSDNIDIGTDTASVTVEGAGNYEGTAVKRFSITAVPGSAITCTVVACRPEDESIVPAVSIKDGGKTLAEGTDYELKLEYDIPAKTGTATVKFKGAYSGTRTVSFDLPNYLVTEGAGASWSKSTSGALAFRANGAFGKFTELTVDGKTVPKSYYTAESGSTVVRLKADYLKGLTAGRHIIGIAYQDGKALAIFSVTSVERRGVATGDDNDLRPWIALMGASLVGIGALAFFALGRGRKKKKKKARH